MPDDMKGLIRRTLGSSGTDVSTRCFATGSRNAAREDATETKNEEPRRPDHADKDEGDREFDVVKTQHPPVEYKREHERVVDFSISVESHFPLISSNSFAFHFNLLLFVHVLIADGVPVNRKLRVTHGKLLTSASEIQLTIRNVENKFSDLGI